MADQSAANPGFFTLQHNPGNPLFPTLPDPLADKLGKVGITGRLADPQPFLPEPFLVSSAAPPPPKRTASFGGWFLDTIWRSPADVNFGDIAAQKDVNLTLFNTFFTVQEIQAIAGLPSGVTLFAPTLPEDLPSFSDEILTFRAAQSGPNEFDQLFTITVEGVDFQVRTLGQRVLLLFGDPANGAQEQLIFKTDLMRSKDGKEQSFSLRVAPRTVVRYVFQFTSEQDKDRTRIETILFGGAPVLALGVQLWWEARPITSAVSSGATLIPCDPSNFSVVAGDTVVFALPDGTFATGTYSADASPANGILLDVGVTQDLPLGTFIMPVRFGHLNSSNLSIARNNLETITVELLLEGDRDLSAINTTYFDTHPLDSPERYILKERCTVGTLSANISREEQRIDSETGRVYVTGTEPLGEYSTNVVVYTNTYEELYAWRQFLHLQRGSWGTFYAPTFQNDLPLFTDLSLGGNTFIVPFMGISTFLDGDPPKRDLRIVTSDGTVYYRRITLVTDNGNGTETITVDSVIGSVGTSAIDETTISWMHLVRIAGDVASFNHIFLGEADLSFRVRTVKE